MSFFNFLDFLETLQDRSEKLFKSQNKIEWKKLNMALWRSALHLSIYSIIFIC